MMKLEHCHKCKKQIEFPKKKKDIGKYYPFDATTDMVEDYSVGLKKKNSTSEFLYCHECFYKIVSVLSAKGFIERDEVL